MKRNKELFFNRTGKRLNLKKFKESPSDLSHFIEVISELKNININNEEWILAFYDKYANIIFPSILKK